MLVDAATKDDAAVFRMSEDRALVVTLDFFAPIVDDAYAFGAIAATNALSDVYAMGATPLFALNIVGWPRDPEILALLSETLRGGSEVAREAGIFVVGGHSVDDREPKYGMVVVGEVHPDRVRTNAGGQPGDALVLTKPIGTGVLATALKQGTIVEAAMAEAVRVMRTLNRGAAAAADALGGAIHALTDITGFGLLGHLGHILTASGVSARLDASALPTLEGVRELIEQGIAPGGTRRNLEAISAFTRWGDGVDEVDRVLCADAQTSGGLLVAVHPERADALVDALRREGTPAAAVIGTLEAGEPGTVEVVRT